MNPSSMFFRPYLGLPHPFTQQLIWQMAWLRTNYGRHWLLKAYGGRLYTVSWSKIPSSFTVEE